MLETLLGLRAFFGLTNKIVLAVAVFYVSTTLGIVLLTSWMLYIGVALMSEKALHEREKHAMEKLLNAYTENVTGGNA